MGKRRLAGIFLLSAATLLLELSLTRVLSVSLWYHFAFLVISTALLGYGSAGITVALSPRLREPRDPDALIAGLALAFGLCVLASHTAAQHIPFDPFSLGRDPRQWALMPLCEVALAAPFYLAGLALAVLFTRAGRGVNALYAADLVGSAAGSIAVVATMRAVGGSGSIALAAALGLAAAAAFALPARRALAGAAAALALACALGAPAADVWLPIHVTPNKRRPARPPIYTAWNTFSRVDVYDLPARGPGGAAERAFAIDGGTAWTGIWDLRPSVAEAIARPPPADEDDLGLAYVNRDHPRVLVIGSGAGSDVFWALRHGASKVTAVEINDIMVDVATRRMPAWWGGLFARPEVTLVVDEGRSFVRRSKEKYDAIVSTHTISNAAVASGAMSLAENYLLTVEAIEDDLDHLAPGGAISFTRPEIQLPRLVATLREAFERKGLGNLAGRLVVFRRAEPSGRPSFFAGVVARTTPFTGADLAVLRQRLRIGAGGPFELLYAPGEGEGSIYDRLATAPDWARVVEHARFDLVPATDDRPFFNQHARWSQLDWAAVKGVFSAGATGRMALETAPIAEVTLLVLFAQVTLLAALLILLPLVAVRRDRLAPRVAAPLLAYFGALGLGFIFVEIALVQRLTLFLGQPVYTLAAVLATLLCASGLGSAAAGRAADPRRALALAIPLVLAALAFTALGAPPILSAALGLSAPARVAVAVLLVAPVGFFLGMPFPLGLRLASAHAPVYVAWAWGVNGFFTVMGGVLVQIAGMALGFKFVFASAAALYLVALAIARFAPRPAAQPTAS